MVIIFNTFFFLDNRETPIRVCYRPKEGIKEGMDVNFEFKCVDATANPYIALAALLSAGIDGIKKGLELNMLDCQGKKNQIIIYKQISHF